MRRFVAFAAIAAAALLQTVPTHAGLLGSTLTLNYDFQGAPLTTDVLTAGAGIEVTCTGSGAGNANVCADLTGGTSQSVDIGDFTIDYRYAGENSGFNNVVPNEFQFQGLNPGGDIVGVTLSTDLGGLDLTRVSFTTNSVIVDMHGTTISAPSGFFTLTLQTAIPEPTAMTILLAGLFGLGTARRRGV